MLPDVELHYKAVVIKTARHRDKGKRMDGPEQRAQK